MNQVKLVLLAFGIAFIKTAALCVVTGNPLIYYPIDYGMGGVFRFGLLMLSLCFRLVYINLSVLKWVKKILKNSFSPTFYFPIVTLLLVQLVTMVTGYFETLTTRGVEPDILYYYRCVSSSCLYILSGNLTALLTSYLYGKEENKKTTAKKAKNHNHINLRVLRLFS